MSSEPEARRPSVRMPGRRPARDDRGASPAHRVVVQELNRVIAAARGDRPGRQARHHRPHVVRITTTPASFPETASQITTAPLPDRLTRDDRPGVSHQGERRAGGYARNQEVQGCDQPVTTSQSWISYRRAPRPACGCGPRRRQGVDTIRLMAKPMTHQPRAEVADVGGVRERLPAARFPPCSNTSASEEATGHRP